MNRVKKAFTLVEILIVVIILGILAAIVIPQFTSASEEARESSLDTDLQGLRSQISLYKLQHHDRGPDVQSTDEGQSWTADANNFVTRMTGTTDEWGQTSGSAFGPYFQEFPSNPFANDSVDNDVAVVADEDAKNATPTTAGWIYCSAEGTIFPSDTAHLDD